MSTPKRPYDSTLARMAGNVAAGLVAFHSDTAFIATEAVSIARAIIAELSLADEAPDVCRECGAVAGPTEGEHRPGCLYLDREIVDAITALMSNEEWNADTTSDIADLVRRTGRKIKDIE